MFKKIMNVTTNAAINVTAAGAGGLVGAYAINHDICNDEDMSLVAGVVGGVGTFCVVRGALKSVKAGVCGGVNTIRTKLAKKSKTSATT